jgi:hypothetical protein
MKRGENLSQKYPVTTQKSSTHLVIRALPFPAAR